MSYRRRSDHAHQAEWRVWIEQHRPTLERIGLPLRVYEDAGRWDDFLQNGELHWHDDPGRFDFTQLADGQLRQLRAFLEHAYGAAGEPPPLLSWLRVRLGDG